MIRNRKKSEITLAIFILLRFLMFYANSSFEDLLKLKMNTNEIIHLVLLIVFSFLFSILMNEVYNLNPKQMLLPCMMISLDLMVILIQSKIVTSFIYVIWMLYFVLVIDNKIKFNRITIIILSFVSISLQPTLAFGLVALAVCIELIINECCKKNKDCLFVFAEIITCIAAFFVNTISIKKINIANTYITSNSLFIFNPKGRIGALLFCLPAYLLGIVLLIVVYKQLKLFKSRKRKTPKNDIIINKTFYAYRLLIITMLINLIGVVVDWNNGAILTTYTIIPVIVISLVYKENGFVVSQMDLISNWIDNHKYVFWFIAIIVYIVFFMVLKISEVINCSGAYDCIYNSCLA